MNKTWKVLIANNIESTIEELSAIFTGKYQVLPARNREQIIYSIGKYCDRLALILLGSNISNEDKLAVLAYLRKHKLLDKIPTMFIASTKDIDFELQAYSAGVTDILTLPLTEEIIRHRARSLIELYVVRQNLQKQLKQYNAKMSDMRTYDQLTDVLSKEAFFASAEAALKNLDDKETQEYVIFFCNICNFRYYNVKYGIDEGNKVLKRLADMILKHVPSHITGRFAQDHFVTLMPTDDPAPFAEKVYKEFTEAYASFGMTLNIGIYRLQHAGEKISAACEYAKLACDHIRNTAKSYYIYTEELSSKFDLNAYIVQHFEEALRKKYIRIYYQPVIRTINGKVCGAEALVRWIDPQITYLSPGYFIPVLEETHLITKLDLYVLKQICSDFADFTANGKPLVPLSINLSRIDFLECDIVREVDKIVTEHNIPRNIINIEVTESTLMYNPRRIAQDISRFRALGYQVWMDDFGSGYSSLNVLKNYSFDKLKLDMAFMSSLDATSKEIVTAIVSMSKKIGISTLAEGVETQEQYDFLRSIGCEQVQGYLFGKPQPLEEIIRMYRDNHDKVENIVWRNYYEKMGAPNFITEKTLAIIEFDGKNFDFVYMNNHYMDVLRETGITDLQTVYTNMNAPFSPLNRLYLDFMDRCQLDSGKQSLVYSIRDHYLRLTVERIAEQDDRAVFLTEVTNLSVTESSETRTLLDKTARRLYSMFDAILLVDLNTNNVTILQRWDSLADQHDFSPLVTKNTKEALENVSHLIHPADRERFFRFCDFSTLKERISQSRQGYLTEYLRTCQHNNSYVWKAHTLIYRSDSNEAVYCTRHAPIMDDTIINILLAANPEKFAPELPNQAKLISQSIMKSHTINMFWKDKNRRFTGANESFLATYGFSDVSAILGKTDEDMGWHINDDPYANDEKNVLEHGAVTSFRPGVCIIKGVAHNIIASKEPLFDADGKIIGLAGYFINADQLNQQESLSSIDPLTGLMSPQALLNIIAEYMDEWNFQRKNFAVITITLKDYHIVAKTYGKTVAAQMFNEIALLLSQVTGLKGSAGRLYSGKFVIVMKFVTKELIEGFVYSLKQKLAAVQKLAGHNVTLYPKIKTFYADEQKNISDMLEMSVASSLIAKHEDTYQLLELDRVFETYETLSEIVYAFNIDTHELIYMNRRARDYYGVPSLTDIEGKMCYAVLRKEPAPCATCNNDKVVRGEPFEWDFFNEQEKMLFHMRAQMVYYNGQRVRINIVSPASGEEAAQAASNMQTPLLLSECMRLALEETDMETGLNNLIKYLGRSLECERTYIFELSDKQDWSNTYEWCKSGIVPKISWLQNIPYEVTDVWRKQFESNHTVIIKNIDDIKDTDPVTYEYLQHQKITSIIIAPIYINEKLCGFYGIDNAPAAKIDIAAPMLQSITNVIVTMISKRDKQNTLERLSYIDNLSQLNNRNALESLIPTLDRGSSIGIMFLDICGLKLVNDSFGHLAGDKLLMQAATLLKTVFRAHDLFRWGGDEMLAVASGITRTDFYNRCATLKTLAFNQHLPLAIGTVWESEIVGSVEGLINAADHKMYEDKQSIYNHISLKNILMKNEAIK